MTTNANETNRRKRKTINKNANKTTKRNKQKQITNANEFGY